VQGPRRDAFTVYSDSRAAKPIEAPTGDKMAAVTPINPGNSGGVLLDDQGRLIGASV
jgi:S1-C subfamily serine protease